MNIRISEKAHGILKEHQRRAVGKLGRHVSFSELIERVAGMNYQTDYITAVQAPDSARIVRLRADLERLADSVTGVPQNVLEAEK